MNLDDLTALFAKRFLGLKPTRDRFLRPDGSWMPRWRFAPFTCLDDAFVLLDRASDGYTLTNAGGVFTAEVRVGTRTGKATGKPKAKTITLAIAQAFGIEAPQ
jgi:hypothetical protein